MSWLSDAVTTGKNTPWGAPDHQDPGNPDYKTDPNSMPNQFDYSGMKKSMEQGLRLQRARGDVSTQQAISQANPYGASSETGRAIGRSSADLEQGINSGNANIDRQAYNDKVQAMTNYNTNLKNQYDVAKGRSDKEDAQRQKFWDKGSSVLTLGLGG